MLIGVKTEKKLKIDFVDVEFAPAEHAEIPEVGDAPSASSLLVPIAPAGKLLRAQSRAFLTDDGMPQPIEFFIASDASAIVEHTKRVLYLEDDDIAHIAEGGAHSLTLFALSRSRVYFDYFPLTLFYFQSSTSTAFAATTVKFRPSELSRPWRLSSLPS